MVLNAVYIAVPRGGERERGLEMAKILVEA